MPPSNRYRTALIVAAAAVAMLVPGAAVHAQDASPSAIPSGPPLAASTPRVTATPPPGAEELAAMVPTEIMGEAVPVPIMYSGLDWLGERAEPFEQILVDLGKTAEDLSATRFVTVTLGSGGVEFQGLRIAGADAGAFAEALIPLLEQTNLGPLDRETVELAGKSIIVLSDADDGEVSYNLYAVDDVVWAAAGDDESLAQLLEQLP